MGRVQARKTIEGRLSREGIDHIVKELDRYQTDVKHATAKFVERLAEKGYKVATKKIVESFPTLDSDKPIGLLEIQMDSKGHLASCRLQFSSQQALFIEFGAGYYYNQGSAHPYAGEYGNIPISETRI